MSCTALEFWARVEIKLETRLSPGRVVVCLAQGACLVRAKVRVQKSFPFTSKLSILQLAWGKSLDTAARIIAKHYQNLILSSEASRRFQNHSVPLNCTINRINTTNKITAPNKSIANDPCPLTLVPLITRREALLRKFIYRTASLKRISLSRNIEFTQVI